MNQLVNPANSRIALSSNRVWLFFALTILVTSGIIFASYRLENEGLSILSVFVPTTMAILVSYWFGGRQEVATLLLKRTWGRLNWGLAFFALAIIPFLAASAVWLSSFAAGPPLGFRTTQLLPQIIVILLISIGEEYGWRGFAQSELQKFVSPLMATLIVGIVWGVWHYPASLIGTGVPLEMPFWVFMMWVIPATLIMGWIYKRTESVLAAIILHSAANASFNYLPLLPEFVGQLQTFTVLLGLVWLVGVGLWVADGILARRNPST